MADGVRVEVTDFDRFAAAMRAGGQILEREVRSALEKGSREISDLTVRQGSDEMPAGGGLRARLAAAHGTTVVKLRGNDVEATISIRDTQGDAIGLIDKGLLAHKVWGEWRGAPLQHVPARAFSGAFARQAPPRTAENLRKAVQAAMSTITRKA